MTMSGNLPENDLRQMELPLTLSPLAGPVRTSPLPEADSALPASVPDSGGMSRDSFARYDPATSSWRTSQRCFLEDWQTFSATWPRSGMMRNGTAYRLPPLARVTDEIGSGLLPTPSAVTYGSNQGGGMGRVGPVRYSLESMARMKLLPTSKAASGGPEFVKLDRPSTGMSLETVVRLLPPPQATDYRSGTGSSHDGKSQTPQLRHISGGLLNPRFVEEMMGFPIDHSDCGR